MGEGHQGRQRQDRYLTYAARCERARSDAYADMVKHAEQLGANAVVGVRYDATELMAGLTEVLCYGTAVVVEPAR